jgi:hypothetical protein
MAMKHVASTLFRPARAIATPVDAAVYVLLVAF